MLDSARHGLALVLVACAHAAPVAEAPSPRCAEAAYHHFDFWIGDWDAYERGGDGKPVAHLVVTPMLGGCALREVYRQNDGLVGESFSAYDASRRVWHQSWVTNGGALLVIEGGFADGAMTLVGTQRTQDGTVRTVRGVWRKEGNGVREIADVSTDGGATWRPWFDVEFRRR